MKKELLRVHNLTYQCTPIRFVEQISLCIMEGSCVGFFWSGRFGKRFTGTAAYRENRIGFEQVSILHS